MNIISTENCYNKRKVGVIFLGMWVQSAFFGFKVFELYADDYQTRLPNIIKLRKSLISRLILMLIFDILEWPQSLNSLSCLK